MRRPTRGAYITESRAAAVDNTSSPTSVGEGMRETGLGSSCVFGGKPVSSALRCFTNFCRLARVAQDVVISSELFVFFLTHCCPNRQYAVKPPIRENSP